MLSNRKYIVEQNGLMLIHLSMFIHYETLIH